MRQKQRITIVGGGLAGLAAANGLKQYGFDADIFEQSPALGEIGAGINVSPQAVKALRAIGCSDEALSVARTSKGIFTRDMHTGDEVSFMDLRDAANKYGAPFLSFHRADLVDLLAAGLDPARIHLGRKLKSLEETASEIRLTFENGETHATDLLIGADGVRSVVRETLYGPKAPQYTGQMVWRAFIPGEQVPPEVLEPSGHIRWVGPGRHFFGYYLRGNKVVNIVTQQDTEDWVDEGWAIDGDPVELRASFPNPEPRLEKLMSLITSCSKWGLFLREPSEEWGRGRIQLIGDSAHAMLPNAGQGACQAFEDACIMARWLSEEDDPVDAFANFRRIRIPRVHGVQRRSAANARIFHLSDRTKRDQMVNDTDKGKGGVDWIFRYEPLLDWNKVPSVPEFAG